MASNNTLEYLANKKNSENKKNIFSAFIKKATSKNTIEFDYLQPNKATRISTKNQSNNNQSVNRKKTIELTSIDGKKTVEIKLSKTQDVGEEKKVIATNMSEDSKNSQISIGNTKSTLGKKPLTSDPVSSNTSVNPTPILYRKQSQHILRSDISQTSISIDENDFILSDLEKIHKDTGKQLTSVDIDYPNEKWYKRQMIVFLKKLPRCGPKYPTREVSFTLLNAYLDFLSNKVANKNTSLAKNGGQTFHAFGENILISIIHQVAAICEKESMLLKIKIQNEKNDVIIMSDIHGSLFDLIRAFVIYGLPGDKTYLFLGDYVDRGEYEIEVTILLFLLKICFPYSIFFLRGNHEFPDQNRKADFPKSCKKHFNSFNYWRLINFAFNRFSLAAIIENQIYCAHGGVSQWMKGRETIEKLVKPMNQNKTLIERLIITDTVWSDTFRDERQKSTDLFLPSIRNIGYAYSKTALKKILSDLEVKKMIRGHHPHPDGFYEDYKKICYTVHTSQLEKGSKGSVCRVFKKAKSSEVGMEALNYYIEGFFASVATIANAINDIRKEYLFRQKEFLLQDDTRHINKQKLSTSVYKYSGNNKGQKTTEVKECFYCTNYKFLMKECCSRRRIFVTHLQIYTFMMKYNFIKRIEQILPFKVTVFDKKFELCIRGFPSFLDFLHSKVKRHHELTSDTENKIITYLNKGINRFSPKITKFTEIGYNILPNQMFYDNVEDEDKEFNYDPYFCFEVTKQFEDDEENEIKDII
uniref:Serine/threonine-protein phosphatase n=1 Tax=Strongyloides stercoralis TaxID=6248 RepID=A0A0K0EQ72_STRER